jgi:hypothetical protein
MQALELFALLEGNRGFTVAAGTNGNMVLQACLADGSEVVIGFNDVGHPVILYMRDTEGKELLGDNFDDAALRHLA